MTRPRNRFFISRGKDAPGLDWLLLALVATLGHFVGVIGRLDCPESDAGSVLSDVPPRIVCPVHCLGIVTTHLAGR
jgi:hypothetical protein